MRQLNEEIFSVVFTIYLRDKIVEQFSMRAPRAILELQFISLVQNITFQDEPMKLIMSRDEIIWDKFEQRTKILPITMEFCNY